MASRQWAQKRSDCQGRFPAEQIYDVSERKMQCSGSMTFWCGSGSGSADPNFKKSFPVYYFLGYLYIIFKEKSQKDVTKQ
jgi:hypothetical protein